LFYVDFGPMVMEGPANDHLYIWTSFYDIHNNKVVKMRIVLKLKRLETSLASFTLKSANTLAKKCRVKLLKKCKKIVVDVDDSILLPNITLL
jgi:hypothetical protein